MTDVLRPAAETRQSPSPQRDVLGPFGHIERAIAVGIAAILSLAAVLALAGAVTLAWDAMTQWPHIRSLFVIVDRLLFVLMVIEILHTVRASIQTHQLSSEPFLIVGMIATIRRILVVTLETSDRPESQATAAAPSFEHAMIELGMLGMLTLVLAVAIYLSRRSRGQSP